MQQSKISNLLTKRGLYEPIEIDITDLSMMRALFDDNISIDSFCPSCMKESTFNGDGFGVVKISSAVPLASSKIYNGVGYVSVETQQSIEFSKMLYNNPAKHLVVKCSRNPTHELHFSLLIDETSIVKYGQFPSIRSLTDDEKIKKYRKQLGEYYKDFSTGIGLYSHGVGAGSFVYLRRVFEKLIFRTFDEHKNEISIDEAEFKSLKMKEKIKELKSFLPEFISETTALYSILSKGIHELEEEACKVYFPVLQAAICLILDEKITMLEKKKREAEISKSIQHIHTELLK